jgi:hypothetical protein
MENSREGSKNESNKTGSDHFQNRLEYLDMGISSPSKTIVISKLSGPNGKVCDERKLRSESAEDDSFVIPLTHSWAKHLSHGKAKNGGFMNNSKSISDASEYEVFLLHHFINSFCSTVVDISVRARHYSSKPNPKHSQYQENLERNGKENCSLISQRESQRYIAIHTWEASFKSLLSKYFQIWLKFVRKQVFSHLRFQNEISEIKRLRIMRRTFKSWFMMLKIVFLENVSIDC